VLESHGKSHRRQTQSVEAPTSKRPAAANLIVEARNRGVAHFGTLVISFVEPADDIALQNSQRTERTPQYVPYLRAALTRAVKAIEPHWPPEAGLSVGSQVLGCLRARQIEGDTR
jgi:hypothetical protein